MTPQKREGKENKGIPSVPTLTVLWLQTACLHHIVIPI